MDKLLLKEDRIHGDASFPLDSYHMDIPSGSIVLDCHWHEEMEFADDLRESAVQDRYRLL